MADDTNGNAAQVAGAAVSQADDDHAPTPQAGEGKAQAAEPISLEEARKLRREAQQLRRDRESLAAKLKEIEDAKLSETERMQRELKALQDERDSWARERRERDARDTVIEAASAADIAARNPRAVWRLVKDDLDYDDEGNVKNLKAVLKQAVADYPELFGSRFGSGDGGAGARGSTAGAFDMNDRIRAQLARGRL